MSDVTFEPFDFHGELNPDNFKRFVVYAAERGVSDILIQGGDYIWVELHGRQRRASHQTVKQGQLSALISSVWGPDVEGAIRSGTGADRSLDLFGEELGIPRGKRLRARCNFIQARVALLDAAFAITMRLIPPDLPDITTMGIEPDLFEAFYPAKGLVLVCGPTGSGKTTLLAGVYGYAGVAMPDRKVITYEDPIEFVLGGAHWKGPQPAQSQIGRDIANFAAGLRNAMRRKPSIIGIGEARDLETIDAAIEAGLTGHLCFATMHTDSVAETINRAIQVYPPAQQSAIANRLLGSLALIVVQRLLKTTDGKRQAIREYVIFDRELRNELQDQSFERWPKMIREKLEAAGATLDDKAWALLQAGTIDKQEFIELAGHKAYVQRIKGAKS
ncbi:plasmid transfer ATPase TraJ [Azohydromonas lata]|uniref:plasmid transfer ATPase TraJ n=1 Tax=Azohydromonas lata TaxID=45677 RepID=UPI00082F19B1|nr:plasmid transfer ATPase TraJ [Azohydromonas lata]